MEITIIIIIITLFWGNPGKCRKDKSMPWNNQLKDEHHKE